MYSPDYNGFNPAYENKSGKAFCYAVIAYKCAWLSLYYPVEFAVACCTIKEDAEDIVKTLSLVKKRKIPLAGPDINKSGMGFTCEQMGVNLGIRFGLRAIKHVGASVINFIDEYRNDPRSTPFKNFDDFYIKVHDNEGPIVSGILGRMRKATGKNTPNPMKRDAELALIFAGAFDFAHKDRYRLAVHYLIDIRKEKSISVKIGTKEYKNFPNYVRKEKLMLEKEYMGAYISEHPLDTFSYGDFSATAENDKIKTTVLVSSASLKNTKRGTQFLSVKGTDKTNLEITVNVFDEQKAVSLKKDLKKNSIFIVEGTVSRKYNNINAKSAKIAVRQSVPTEPLDDGGNIMKKALNEMFS